MPSQPLTPEDEELKITIHRLLDQARNFHHFKLLSLKSQATKAINRHDQQKELEWNQREARLLNALGLMYAQYCSKPMGHDFMGAGEAAIGILEDYEIHDEDVEWTSETYDRLDDVVARLKAPANPQKGK